MAKKTHTRAWPMASTGQPHRISRTKTKKSSPATRKTKTGRAPSPKTAAKPSPPLRQQVWTLAQFLWFPFCKKSLICLQINDPSSGKLYSLPLLPATPSSLSRTLDSPRALLPELQRYKDTVRCAALGAEVPGHHQQQLSRTLIARLWKTHFLHTDP